MANPEPHYHAGLVVQDIEAAMEELTAALGVSWSEVLRIEVVDRSRRERVERRIQGNPPGDP